MIYIQHKGDWLELNKQQLSDFFKEGRLSMVYGRGENGTTTSVALDQEPIDTRGQCYSAWDEVWTAPATAWHTVWHAAVQKFESGTK
jgi:hypothetical protein